MTGFGRWDASEALGVGTGSVLGLRTVSGRQVEACRARRGEWECVGGQ